MLEVKDNELLFAKVRPEAIIPTKEKENAGYDIYACFEGDYMIIPPHSTKLISTGIASCVSDNYYLQVHERGSTGSKGMKYSAGVIDSSYRGEIFIALTNTNDVDIIISKHSREELIEFYSDDDRRKNGTYLLDDDRKVYLEDYSESNNKTCIIYPYTKAIAQLIIHRVHNELEAKEIPYDELKEIPSKRGTGSLGSSGK